MGMDLTADSLDQPISAQSIVKSAQSNLKVPEGFSSEHPASKTIAEKLLSFLN